MTRSFPKKSRCGRLYQSKKKKMAVTGSDDVRGGGNARAGVDACFEDGVRDNG